MKSDDCWLQLKGQKQMVDFILSFSFNYESPPHNKLVIHSNTWVLIHQCSTLILSSWREKTNCEDGGSNKSPCWQVWKWGPTYNMGSTWVHQSACWSLACLLVLLSGNTEIFNMALLEDDCDTPLGRSFNIFQVYLSE